MANDKSNKQQQQKDVSGNPLHPGADNPHHAPESGEPKEAGRQQGRVINPDGTPAGDRRGGKGGDTDLESGRHGTK